MTAHVLMFSIILLLAAVVVLQWQVLRRKNDPRKDQQTSSGDEVLWSRGGKMTRRLFVPSAVAGLVAMFVFRTASRNSRLSNKTAPPEHNNAEEADHNNAIRSARHNGIEEADHNNAIRSARHNGIEEADHNNAIRSSRYNNNALEAKNAPPVHNDVSEVGHNDIA